MKKSWVSSHETSGNLTASMCVFYLLFCLISGMVAAMGSLVPEPFEILGMAVFLWPYPLLLSLQHWVDPGRLLNLILADVIGLGAVFVTGAIAQRRFGRAIQRRTSILVSTLLWYLPLLVLQLAAWGMAISLGFPVGE